MYVHIHILYGILISHIIFYIKYVTSKNKMCYSLSDINSHFMDHIGRTFTEMRDSHSNLYRSRKKKKIKTSERFNNSVSFFPSHTVCDYIKRICRAKIEAIFT